jgi:hypothetical protein
MPEAIGVRLRRWWAAKVAPEVTPRAVGGSPQAVSAHLRRRLNRAIQGTALGLR